MNQEKKHFPVLLNEIIKIITPFYGGTFIDCTFGQGGYTKKILEDNPNNLVFAIDRDPKVNKKIENFQKKYYPRLKFYNVKFSNIDKINLVKYRPKAIIYDLGYSMDQINDNSKGLSFKSNSPLNMRLGHNDLSAEDVVNKMSQENLYKIFKNFGNEPKSKKISKLIIEKRKFKTLNTQDLVEIINLSKKFGHKRIHNATKIFQSLRIFVNCEISELIFSLINSFKILPVGGMILVVTFHSIEDKIVKFFFKHFSQYQNNSRYFPKNKEKKILFKIEKKKPILPNFDEIKVNPSSRSAKLRYAIKLNHSNNFDEFTNKFKNFLDIESLRKEI